MSALFPSVETEILREVKRLGLTFEAREDAPSTFEALVTQCPGKYLIVWSGGSENTIWSSSEVNYAFRAWHDYIHVQYNLPFTLEGETAVSRIQQSRLSMFARQIILIEVELQAKHFLSTGEFISNQREFTVNKLKRGDL